MTKILFYLIIMLTSFAFSEVGVKYAGFDELKVTSNPFEKNESNIGGNGDNDTSFDYFLYHTIPTSASGCIANRFANQPEPAPSCNNTNQFSIRGPPA